MKKNRKRKNRGFSLMELLTVMMIIAVLSVLAASAYKNMSSTASKVTARGLEGKLNNAANEWMTLKIHSGAVNTRLSHLGSTLEEAIETLKEPIVIDGEKVSTGIAKSLKSKKVRDLQIEFDPAEGEFTYTGDDENEA